MTWRLTQFRVQGVKGVLSRAGDFDLSDGRSLAIYAPNGCGKSGYADALEYLFSTDGAVEHLGQGAEDSERGGKHALPHVLARDRGIVPEVSIRLRNSSSGKAMQITRAVKTGRNDPMPTELAALVEAAPAHRILRQHDLRRFVVEMDPRDKYSELSRWLGLERLEQVLVHLTTASNFLQNTTIDREITERLKDVAKHTSESVTTDDERATLQWCATESTRHLGEATAVASVGELTIIIEKLQTLRNAIVLRANKATPAFNAKVVLEDVVVRWPAGDGLLDGCAAVLETLAEAERNVEQASAAAKEGMFQETWAAASKLLKKQASSACPICTTPWEETRIKSQPAALERMESGLEALGDLQRALGKRQSAWDAATAAMGTLQTSISRLEEAARTLSLSAVVDDAASLAKKIRGDGLPQRTQSQAHADYVASVQHCRELATATVPALLGTVEVEGIPPRAKEIDGAIDRIRALKEALTRLAELRRESHEIRNVERAFASVTRAIQESAQQLLNDVLRALREDVKAIYKKIHPHVDIRNIHIELGANTKSLMVRVDFHAEDRRVPPGGYLSEAQINTLGLALFISTVRLFNREFPFLVLDDIVSSYDADNRLRIVDVIAEDLQGFQVFLTTHDERFYEALRRRLEDKGWRFDRITAWSLEEGPRRQTEGTKPHQIDELIKAGNLQAAGNAVRQYLEEWLDEMCAKYEAYTLHRRGNKDFDRTLFDFWGPFVRRLQELGGGWFEKHVQSSASFERLRNHGLINYYSHAQANPYGWGSIGDVKYVWDEFKSFQQLFNCKTCGKAYRFDRGSGRLFCTCSADVDGAGGEVAP